MRSIVSGTVDLFGGTSEVRNGQRRIVSRARELRLDMRRLFDEKGRPNAVWVFYEAVRVVSSAVYERLLRGMRRLAGEGSQSRGDECPPRVASRRLFGASCDIVGGMRHPRAVPHCRAATCVTCPRWYASSWRTFTSSQRRCVGHGGGTWRDTLTATVAGLPPVALSRRRQSRRQCQASHCPATGRHSRMPWDRPSPRRRRRSRSQGPVRARSPV
jgi:hypothetical protein